jgi:hypothetical protein
MDKFELIAGENPWSAQQRRSLRCLLGRMIPASVEYGVPGADDEAIFADVLTTARPHANHVDHALQRLDALADGSFADLDATRQLVVAETFRTEAPALASLLAAITVQCYYRDDRVMRSLDMEARPPFPKGFNVEPGDWSLLDAVRARPKFYRDAP